MSAPIAAEQASRTAVLRPIILLYSSMGTSCRDSNSMSYCCPSQTWAAVRENSAITRSSTACGALAMR